MPGVAVVFQVYRSSLMSWLTLQGNILLPLRAKGISRREGKQIAKQSLEVVGLGGKDNWHPRQLSGGMPHRASIARALACKPEILMMDEPFASVGAQTRMELEDLLLSIRSQYDVSIMVVTHDRPLPVRPGRRAQQGTITCP